MMAEIDAPTLGEIESAREGLGDLVRTTPVWPWLCEPVERALGENTDVRLKLELFQKTGTFKPRGALTVMMRLAPDALARGVTTVSAGNHAIATAFAAKTLGSSAKVVMPKSASRARVKAAQRFGAEVTLVDGVHAAFAEVERIRDEEGRTFVHPFEGALTSLGTATLGLEIAREVGALDAVIVPIGGGGLASGVACAVKQLQPGCAVYGVEPEGADSMHRSFAAGEPQAIERVGTIADSLGAPHAAEYSFNLCRAYLDELVMIDDDAMRRSMALLMREMKLAVEPAGAASTAALLGPLRERLRGKRVCAIVCGANIDVETYREHTARGFELLDAEGF